MVQVSSEISWFEREEEVLALTEGSMSSSYTKPKGQLPDYTSPVVLPYCKTTVEDFCMKIHKNLIKDFK